MLRAIVIHFAGPQFADIVPKDGQFAPGEQGQMAILENAIFSANGGPLPVLVNQDHLAHATQHAMVGQNMEQIAAQALNTRANDQIVRGLKIFGDFVHHFAQHVGELSKIAVPPPEFPQLKTMAENFARAFGHLGSAANKVLLANARNEPGSGGAPAPGGNGAGGDQSHDVTDAQIKLMQAQQDMQIKQQAAETDRQITLQKADVQRQNNEVRTAQKIQLKDLEAQATISAKAAAQEPQVAEAPPQAIPPIGQ
jgi:hypothetical protein